MPKGGSTSADLRTGLGYAGPTSGLGSVYSMGDALSSPKGEWDNFLDLEEDFDEFNDEIENLAFTAFNRTPTDSLAYKGTSIGYLGGIGADMSAVIGMSAGYQPKGNLVAEQQLKDYIKEALMVEKSVSSISSSGRIAVLSSDQGKNLGSEDDDAYGTPLASTNTADAAPKGHLPTSRSAINSKGYYQGHSTTDGAETVNSDAIIAQYINDMILFNSGELSSSEIICKDFGKEYMDSINLNRFK